MIWQNSLGPFDSIAPGTQWKVESGSDLGLLIVARYFNKEAASETRFASPEFIVEGQKNRHNQILSFAGGVFTRSSFAPFFPVGDI